jgi:hypothetical protein
MFAAESLQNLLSSHIAQVVAVSRGEFIESTSEMRLLKICGVQPFIYLAAEGKASVLRAIAAISTSCLLAEPLIAHCFVVLQTAASYDTGTYIDPTQLGD